MGLKSSETSVLGMDSSYTYSVKLCSSLFKFNKSEINYYMYV